MIRRKYSTCACRLPIVCGTTPGPQRLRRGDRPSVHHHAGRRGHLLCVASAAGAPGGAVFGGRARPHTRGWTDGQFRVAASTAHRERRGAGRRRSIGASRRQLDQSWSRLAGRYLPAEAERRSGAYRTASGALDPRCCGQRQDLEAFEAPRHGPGVPSGVDSRGSDRPAHRAVARGGRSLASPRPGRVRNQESGCGKSRAVVAPRLRAFPRKRARMRHRRSTPYSELPSLPNR